LVSEISSSQIQKDAPLLELRSIVKKYTIGDSEVLALDDVSLMIEPGEMLAITGPSGSGKSTLMNILGCLDVADAGTYILAGEDVSHLDADELADIRARRIGFVFQNFNLLPRLTAMENVEMPLLYHGRRDARKAATKALEIVGLASRVHHEPSQLSGGQLQRVAIARAMVTDPAIILADEPTGNLDSHVGQEILELFHKLNRQGRTIVIVTHDPRVAGHCQREVRIQDGKIMQLVEHRQSTQTQV
jgi:putative ABC transport system ATP-binding protein